jgi:predicted dehydrogenase
LLPPPPLHPAVVGTGFIGPVHVEALRRLGHATIALVGSSPERAKQQAAKLKISHVFDSFDALLAEPAFNVIHLATPNRLHFAQCKAALAAGKHVLCEKPLAMTRAESAELAELAARAAREGEVPAEPSSNPGSAGASPSRPTVAAGVCYNVRFYPLNLEARQRIADGQLGRVFHVTGGYSQDWLLHETDFNWRVLSGEGGPLRAVADIGTHWLDLVQFVTGLEVESVCADLATFLPTRQRPAGPVETFLSAAGGTVPVAIDTEDHGSVLLRFKGGATGCFSVSQVTAGRKNRLSYEIAGSRSALAWDSERPNELWLGRRDEPNAVLTRDPALLHPSVRPYANYPGGHNEGFPDTFKQLFRAFYEYIERGDLAAPRPFPTFTDGHREVSLCEAILRSHRERRWVEVVP